MTVVVLLILAIAWAALLIPPVVRARAQGHPADSVGEFHRRLAVLRRTGGFAPERMASPVAPIMPPVMPMRVPGTAQRRRRDIFRTLFALVLATAGLGAVPALRVLWAVNIAADVMLAAYVMLLIRRRNTLVERDEKVRFLPRSAAVAEIALRRSASS